VAVHSPNFSPFPFERLRKVSRRDAAIESVLARWLTVRQPGAKVAALAGGPVRAHRAFAPAAAPDPHAALAEVHLDGVAVTLAASSRPVRALAQRLLGGPDELDAPRPLTVVEHAIWALAVAALIADLDVPAEVWPLEGTRQGADAITVAFAVELPPGFYPAASRASRPTGSPSTGSSGSPSAMTVTASFPADIVLRVPPPRPLHDWRFDLPVVVGRCALPQASLARLRVRDVITIERCLELVIGAGGIGLRAAPGAVEARVATEYVPRHMALLDDAALEVTVQLGTTRLSLRQIGELAVGQIVPLGRPLAGPYEVRAAGRMVGQGELVDIDGELGVRIVSIAEPDQE
jgi:flagellar motor switch/type III secretory pathway protein FliN